MPHAIIDLKLILESVHSTDLQAGSWVNVIGYVRNYPQRQEKRRGIVTDHGHTLEKIEIQALLLWDAGAIMVGEYEAILSRQREMTRAGGNKARSGV